MWSSDDELELVPEAEGTTTTTNTISQSLQAPLQFLLIFLILWQSAFKVSSAAVTSLIRFIKFFLRTVGQAFNDTSIIELESAVPITHEKIHKLLGFDTQNWCMSMWYVRIVILYMNTMIASIYWQMASKNPRGAGI